jgi:penicillin-binding protein 2
MELVRFADRRRYRPNERSPDELMLTRRMFLLKGLVVTGFVALAGKLWQMQMVDSVSYETQAQGNIIKDEPIPAARGMILDRSGEILAENRVIWQVSLTPAQLPRDERDREYVRSQVIATLGLKDMLAIRQNAVPDGISDELVELIASETGVSLDEVRERFENARADDNVIPIKRDLEPEEAERLTEVVRRLPGVVVINYFDYVVESDPVSVTPTVLNPDIDRETALALESNKMYLPGVTVDGEKLVRRYLGGKELAHILGYVGPISEEEYESSRGTTGQSPYLRTDYVGRGGIEQAMESELRGRRGVRFVQTDARGLRLAEIEDRRIDPEPGRSLHLTIDQRFQKAVTRALQEGIDAANEAALAEDKEPVGSGVVVAMDPRTGEILALVSLPNYDNQKFVDGISQADYDELISNPFLPLINLAVSGSFSPGSTLKPLLGCAALEEKTITTETQYRCAGSINVPTVGYESEYNTYVCWWRQGHGTVAIEEAVAESCNIFFYNVGAPHQVAAGMDEPLHYFNPGESTPNYFEGLGIDRIERYLKEEFGFGQRTGIELANETPGVVPNPQWLFQSPLREYWSVGDTINVSIGQGHLECSPLQLTCAMAAIANRGVYYRPRLVRAFGTNNGEVVEELDPDERHVLNIDQENLEVICRGMRRTVTDGTAWDKFPRTGDDIEIAGKTGTADFGEAIDGSYATHHASFCAFAPFDDPEIVVTVLLPGGGEGSTFAVPVADAVLAAYFGREPLEPDEESDQDDPDAGDPDADPQDGEPEDDEEDDGEIAWPHARAG